MRDENIEKADLINLTQWHKAGYTGKGIKVMSFENLEKGHGDEHGWNTLGAFRQSCPDAELFEPNVLHSKTGDKCFVDTVQQAIDNDVDIIFNALHFSIKDEQEPIIQKAIDNGIIILSAAGNENEVIEDETYKTRTDGRHFNNFIQVGAVEPTRTGIKRMKYSNKGKMLDHVAFTNIVTEEGHKFTGTSCATPWDAGVIACILQYYYENDLQHCYDNFMDFVYGMMIDLGEEGRDDLYGKGMIVLPDLESMEVNNMKEIVMIEGSKIALVNGETYEMPEPMTMQNTDGDGYATAMVPLRFVNDVLGCETRWNEESKSVTIIKG